MGAVAKNKGRIILIHTLLMYFLGALLGWSLFLMLYGQDYWILLGIILGSSVSGFIWTIAPSMGVGKRGSKLFIIATLVVLFVAVIIKFNILSMLYMLLKKVNRNSATYIFLSGYLFPFLIKIFFPKQWIGKLAMQDDIKETKERKAADKKKERP